LMVLVALTLRLVVVAFQYQGQMNPRRDHWPFGYETGRIARAIATGRGFSDPVVVGGGPTAWMTPVYPYLVAGVFKLFGIYSAPSAVVLLSLNSLFSALTCIPVFLMARDSFGEKTAVWAGWSWALFPYAIYLSAEWIWETCLTTLLLSLLFLITLRLERSTRLGSWVGYGLLWGITALSDPAVLSLLPLLVGWVCYRLHKRGQRSGLQVVVAVVALVVVVTPWFVRNYRTFHQFIPFRDAFWLVMHVGNNGDTSHWAPDAAHPSTDTKEEQEYNRLGELNYMAEKRREVIEFIRSHPGWYAWVTFRRFVFTWTGFWSLPADGRIEEVFDPDLQFDPAVIALCTTLSVLAFVGLWRALGRGAAVGFLYAFVLIAFPAIYYLTITDLRYRHPVDPELVVLAAYACATFFSKQHEATEEGGGPDARRKPTPATSLPAQSLAFLARSPASP
jgi:4-amino-4-deoxy-L-arabinose transferase-like glycosyltransferase